MITTDRGCQFKSTLFEQLNGLLGTARIRTTAYHPAANGLVEQLHRHLKTALTAHGDTVHWTEHLPLVLLGVRSAIKSDLGCTTAELVYGTTLCLPGEFVAPADTNSVSDPTSYVDRLRAAMASL